MRSRLSPSRTIAALGRVAAVAALAFLSGFAHAVTVAPVLVEVSPAQPVQTVVVSNPGDRPLRFQAQVLAWTQRDGADQRIPSDDLIVAPAIADIPAGGRQIFRIAARAPARDAQRAYRLVLEDISDAPIATGEVGVRLRINHDLPVFVSPANLPAPALVLGPCATPAPACVRIENRGARYGVVRSLQVVAAGQSRDEPVNLRLLPGAWHEWHLPLAAGAVHATTADGVLHYAPASRGN